MTFLEVDTKPSSFYEKFGVIDEVQKNRINAMFGSFEEFCRTKYQRTINEVVSELHKLEDKPKFKQRLFGMMQSYANYLNSKYSPYTTRGYFLIFKKYLKHNGFTFTTDDLKDHVKLPRIIEAEHYPLTLQDMRNLFENIPTKHKALYLVLSSSGIRIKEAIQLRKRDFDTSQKRVKITIPAKYAKNKKSRITFVSKESEGYLKPKLSRLKPDDLVFGTNENPYRARQNEEERFDRIRRNSGLIERFDSGHHKVVIHSFRSWFITKTNRIDYGFGHALAGHGVYMGRYDRLTESEKIELYIQSEPTLQIYDRPTENEKKVLDENKILKRELEDMRQRIVIEQSKKDSKLKEMEEIQNGILRKIERIEKTKPLQ